MGKYPIEKAKEIISSVGGGIADVGEGIANLSAKGKIVLDDAGETLSGITKTEIIGDKVVVPAQSEDFVTSLTKYIESAGYKGGINFGKIGELFDGLEGVEPGSAQSYELMLENIQKNNKELFTWARRKKTLSVKEMMKLAETTSDQSLMTKILTMGRGTPLNAEEVIGSLVVLKKMMLEFKHGSEQLAKVAAPQNETEKLARRTAMKRLQVMAGLMSEFSAKFSAGVAESARAVGMLAHTDKIFGAKLDELNKAAEKLYTEVDERLLDQQIVALTNIGTLGQKQSMLARVGEYAKSGVLLTSKIIQETYIMSLVSGGPTQVVNMAGSIGMQAMTIMERGFSGGVGAAREQVMKLVGGEKARAKVFMDRAYMEEAWMGMIGDIYGIGNGFKMAGITAVTGEANDLATKLDLQSPAIGTTNNLLEVTEKFGKWISGNQTKYNVGGNKTVTDKTINNAGMGIELFFDILGISSRLPGRALVTTDEFFKGMIRQKVIFQEATRRGMETYKILQSKMVNGKPMYQKDELQQAMIDKIALIIANPPSEVIELANKTAIKETFQGDVRAPFSYASPVVNNFFGRTMLSAFYKTPSNIFSEIGDRTINFHPMIQTIKNGQGREFDIAMGKMIMGWGTVLFSMGLVKGMYGDEVIVTGAGPTNRRIQNIIGRGAKVPKSSIGVKQYDADGNFTGEYKFTSFSRMDPISTLLVMSADLHTYEEFRDPALNETFSQQSDLALTKLYNTLFLAATQHSTDMPFLQTLGEFQHMTTRYSETGEEWSNRMVTYIGQRFGDVGGSVQGHLETFTTFNQGYNMTQYLDENHSEWRDQWPLIGTNSFTRSIERIIDPTASNTRALTEENLDRLEVLGIEELSPFVKGFYMAINKHKAGHPAYSEEIPKGMNFWGETAYQIDPDYAQERGWNLMWDPMRIYTGSYSDLDKEIIKISEMTNNAWKYHPKRLSKNMRETETQKDNNKVWEMTAEELNIYSWVVNNIDQNGLVAENLDIGVEGDYDHDTFDTMREIMTDIIGGNNDAYTMGSWDERYEILTNTLSEYRGLARTWMLENVDRLVQLQQNAIMENEEKEF
jgi:hypothetical protein